VIYIQNYLPHLSWLRRVNGTWIGLGNIRFIPPFADD